MGSCDDNQENTILYELLIYSEWALDHEILGGDSVSQGGSIFYRALRQTPRSLLSLATRIGSSFWRQSSITPNLYRILTCGSEWQFAIGAQGAVIAILQDTSLEIRAKKDEFALIVGKNLNLYNDPFPKWRKITWSAECSMVAVAFSNGVVELFNTVGTSLFIIYPPRFQQNEVQVDAGNALSALVFSDARTEKIKWAAELIMIDFEGKVQGYFVSPTEGYQESHSFSLHRLYPRGITAAAVFGSFVIVAGSCQYISDPNLRNNGLGHGLTLWRMLDDFPHYKLVPVIDEEEYAPPNLSLLHNIPWFDSPPPCDSIFRLCVSPSGRQVAVLHSSGSLSIWELPSLRKRKFWSLDNQPGFDVESIQKVRVTSKAAMSNISLIKNHLVDVKWWTEDAVCLVRCSGAVTVCSTMSLNNLLGESPEPFEGVPQISESYDKSFLALELEKTPLKSYSRTFLNSSESSVSEDLMGEESDIFDEEEDLSLTQKAKLFTQNILFWITDVERFRPKNRHSKYISRLYRLLSLKSTSPLELFTRRIENEEYEEALALATKFDLNTDLVYQQQWRKSPVTISTIEDYLTKIRKRSWVLEECLSRVPEDVDAARELIMYGLRGTDLDTLVGIEEGTHTDDFLVSDLSLEFEEDVNMDPVEAEKVAQEWAANDLKRRRELLAKIDFHNLSDDQIEVVKARQTLFRYYDRFSSYELMLGGSLMTPEHYNPTFYETFRSQTEIEAAVTLARETNSRGLEIMLTYHGDSIRAHKLATLSNLPPTMGPYEYKSLLPECDLSGDVFEWEEDVLRDPDWCEDSICKEAVGIEPNTGLKLLYENHPHLERFKCDFPTSDLVADWYITRARELEDSSHFVDAALDLLKIGREKNIPGLEDLQNTLDTLEVLIYEVGLNDMTLSTFESLPDIEKLKLLLSTSILETFIQNVRRWGQTFLNHCDKTDPGHGRQLLREYIVSASSQDLSIALKSIQHSQLDMPDPILNSSLDVLKVALESIYSCENESQIPRAFAILESLPHRKPKMDSKEVTALHNMIDDLEEHLNVVEILSSHGVSVSPALVRDIGCHDNQIRLLFTRLARTACRRELKMSNDDWNKLLSDMLEMQQKIFSSLEPQDCFEILTEALLTSGSKEYIDFASDLLETRADGSPLRNPYLQKIPYGKAVKIVVKAATEYFNSSGNFLDPDMSLAKHCLHLIDSEDLEITAELNLISSLEILPDVGINLLPLQVRLTKSRIDLIADLLEKRPEYYKSGPKLLRLAHLLEAGLGPEEEISRQGRVLELTAQAAYRCGDYEAACSWCLQLVNGGHNGGWNICGRLGRCSELLNLQLKSKFLDFSIAHSPAEYIEEFLDARNEIELSMLYNSINDRLALSGSPESDDGFEDAREGEPGDGSCEERDEPPTELSVQSPISAPFVSDRIFKVTKSVFSATAASTTSLLSNVGSKDLWKNAASWLRPLKDLVPSNVSRGSSDDAELDTGFELQGCHAFYADICPGTHISKLGPSYQSYALPTLSNPTLEVSLTLLRIAFIEETLGIGSCAQSKTTGVLQEISKRIISEDFLLAVSFLQLLDDPHQVYGVLSSLPNTTIALQISLYIYALKIYNSMHPWSKRGIAPVYLHAPSDVINCIRSIIKNSNDLSDDERIGAYAEYFKNADKLFDDYLQGQTLHGLDVGIDIDRFLNDSEYKKDTVLGLAMSSEKDVVAMAISLARNYSIDVWEVYMAQLQYLFDLEEDSKKLEELAIDSTLLNALKENISRFISTMEDSVLPNIDGKDHRRLLVYFLLLLEIDNDISRKNRTKLHKYLLENITTLAPSLNYKVLLVPSPSTMGAIKTVLNAGNVEIFADFADKITKEETFELDSSTVYCMWAQKCFFEAKDKKLKSTNEWLKRFNKVERLLSKLNPKDIDLLIRSIVYSEQGANKVPIEAGKEIIKKTLAYCERRTQETKYLGEKEEWMEVCGRLKVLERHSEILRTEIFESLAHSPDLNLRNYAHQFVLSGGQDSGLVDLSFKILLDRGTLDNLRSVLSVFPEENAKIPEDVFMEVLRMVLGKMSSLDELTNDQTNSYCEILSHLLSELKIYCDDGGDLLDELEVLEEIREFVSKEENPLHVRIRTLTISKQFLDLTEEDTKLLQTMQTGDIVKDAFTSPTRGDIEDETSALKSSSSFKTSEIDTEESRLELLRSLIEKMDSLKKARSTIELLNIWPKFQPKLYCDPESNPWMQVFCKLVESSKLRQESLDLVYATTVQCLEEKQLNEDCIATLIMKLLDSGRQGCLKTAFKINLKTESSSISRIVGRYEDLSDIRDFHYDAELFDLIIDRSVVPLILPTLLYGPFVAYLTEDGSKKDLIRTVVDQLEFSGHWIEASSLAVLSGSFPRALKTATNAVKTFRKCL